MEWLEIVGVLAGIFTTIAAIPQIWKAWKTKQVKDISPLMVIILLCGVGLWTVYGVGKNDWPIILTNGISFLINLTLLYLLIKYRKDR